MSALRRGAGNDKSTSSLRRGNATARQRVNVPTRWLTPQQRPDAAARRCNNTAAQYGISSIRHFGNGPLRQCGLRQRRLRSPHPTHPACRTASAPIRRGNSRAAHTHSHIVHAHSRIPYRMGRAHSNMFPYLMSHAHSHMVPHRMGHAYSHTLPYHMGHAHSHILPYRMDQTAHPPGSTGRGYMSPCRMDRTCPCQKMSQWGLTATIRALYVRKRQNGACFPFALNRDHNKRIKKAQVKALRSRPWRPRIGIPLLISRAMRPLSGVLRQGVPKSLHCMRARRAAQASARRASCA